MRLRLVPRTTEFYDLFKRAGENALDAARLAEQRFREVPDPKVRQSDLKGLERRGDELTREIIELLNTQYITPFDREDIYQLAGAIDDIVDNIENASELLGLYKVDASKEQAVEQCRLLVGAMEHLAAALGELKTLRRVERHLVEVKNREDEGDRILRDALRSLFEDGAEPLDVIRWKDIFDALEEAIDACEAVANVLGNIVVKNV